MAKTPQLPARFKPYLSQALTEGNIRYGAQESALGQLRSQAAHDYGQGLMAQSTATQGLLGALKLAPQQVSNAYAQAGLTSPLLQSLAQSGSPTAQRIASEQASALAGIAQQQIGAHAGQVAGVNRLTDQYNQDVGSIGTQSSALEREKGQFQQDLLDQLISSDRATRHAANQALKAQQFTANQNTAQSNAATTRSITSALIGQGITPVIDKQGNVSIGPPIPGSKAQQQNRPKGPKLATQHEQSSAQSAFGTSLSHAKQMAAGGTSVSDIVNALTAGRPAVAARPAKPLYDPKTGKRMLNPDHTPATKGGSPAVSAIPGVDQTVAQAVAEQAKRGYVSDATITKLHHLGYRVLDFPGLVTQTQHARHPHAGVSPNAQNLLAGGAGGGIG
jgi:Skp family chaperone for outer membrane proteins